MGDTDFVSIKSIMAHEKPASEALIDLIVCTAKRGEGDLLGKRQDKPRKQVRKYRVLGKFLGERAQRHPISLARHLHQNFMNTQCSTNTCGSRAKSLTSYHARFCPLTILRRSYNGYDAAAEEVDQINRTIRVCEDFTSRKIDRLQLIGHTDKLIQG